MQKAVLCLTLPGGQDRQHWRGEINHLMERYSHKLLACGYAVADAAVAPAKSLKLSNTDHPKDAVLSLWADHLYALDDFFSDAAKLGTQQGYAVMESSPKPHHMEPGRLPGMCQTSFLARVSSQSRSAWLAAWLEQNTEVAMQTQSSYAFRQNIVSYALPVNSNNAPPWPLFDGIVEENFPQAAMTSREAFYASEGNTRQYLLNEQKLISSCLKFIDFDAFDCVPMSQYVVKPLSM